jgi:hypothetical protein
MHILFEQSIYITFRFTLPEINQLVIAMDIPDPVVCDNGVKESAQTSLAMLLRRLSYPSRYADIYRLFGWERSRVSRVTQTLSSYIYRRWLYLLRFDSRRLTPTQLKHYADAIHLKGAPLSNCWAFIDGTLKEVARPVHNQRILYNGWKRVHAIKFHALVTPDGLISHLYGPVEGRRHDETLYKESGLAGILEQHSHAPDGSPLVVYGDPAYGLSRHLISPYKGVSLTREQHLFNSGMSKVRESVEWGFHEVISQFAFLDYKKNLKVLLQPVGLLYAVAVLLCNAHVILHGSQISSFFHYPPPTLGQYFHGSLDDAFAFLEGDTGNDIASATPAETWEEPEAASEDINMEQETYEDIVL